MNSGVEPPEKYFKLVAFGRYTMPAEEQPSATLLATIAKFACLSARIRRQGTGSNEAEVAALFREVAKIDAAFDVWEQTASGRWLFSERRDNHLPPQACFRHRYHIYAEIWTARIWNYYRWARILTGQAMLEIASRHPTSAAAIAFDTEREACLGRIERLAEDILVSMPSHWKHPALSPAQRDQIHTYGGVGTGAQGVPATLFHLQTAGAAAGVSYECWKWSVDVLDTVWAHMGMLQAKSLAEVLRTNQDFLAREENERRIVKLEPE